MATLAQAGAKALQRFAVYCGDGVYVRRALNSSQHLDKFGKIGVEVEVSREPVPMRRAEAVNACKVARSVGAGAWLVAA